MINSTLPALEPKTWAIYPILYPAGTGKVGISAMTDPGRALSGAWGTRGGRAGGRDAGTPALFAAAMGTRLAER
jgi:hypothetical protein